MPFQKVEPIIEPYVKTLCWRPYANHPKGCPNFGRKKGCPPNTPVFSEVIDITKGVWAIWNVFNFAGHVDRMQEKHPNWTQRQLECCLYWQPVARKQLREEIKKFCSEYPGMWVVNVPEAMGVNLTATMQKIGVYLEWPPRVKTLQIVLAGYRC